MNWTSGMRIADAWPASAGLVAVEWSDGSFRVFDTKPYHDHWFFGELADAGYFRKMRISSHGAAVEWPNGQDFAPETLYGESLVVERRSDLPEPLAKDVSESRGQTVISSIKPQADGLVSVRWRNGAQGTFDVWAHAGSLIETLGDPAYLMLAKVDASRTRIEWPGGESLAVPFCAD